MSKIIGNTTATPVPRSDWNQVDKKKPDYIRNKPTLGTISEKDAIGKDDLTQEVQSSIDTKASVVTITTAEYEALEEAEATNANTLYMITDEEEPVIPTIQFITWEDDD